MFPPMNCMAHSVYGLSTPLNGERRSRRARKRRWFVRLPGEARPLRNRR